MTARSAAASPSGQDYAGVPPAATSAALTHLEQEHEGHHLREARNYLGPRPGHHLGPAAPMRRGDGRRAPHAPAIPAPRGTVEPGRRCSPSRPGGADRESRTRRSSPPRGAGAAGRKRGTAPTPRAPGRPRPGARHDVTDPAAVKTFTFPWRRPHDFRAQGRERLCWWRTAAGQETWW